MNNIATPPSQTRSFTALFLIEMWERFGYYGMQALIVYYMVQKLGFPDERAALVWGAAAALIYVAPAIGGWIGDKILGTRRTMLIGAVILTAGYSLMVVPGQSVWFLFCSLGVIVVGNGLFNKLGVAALVCTVIAIAVLPLMKKLSLTHHGQGGGWVAVTTSQIPLCVQRGAACR